MRLSSIVIAVSLVAACSNKKTPDPAPEGPRVIDDAKAPVVKKPPVTTPLPPLASDQGGATGKPLSDMTLT